jgi:hypothetical protein
MNASAANPARSSIGLPWWRELHRRQPVLASLALCMLLAALPALLALSLDTRQVHGVNVWVKPLKFMLSLALFSATTAWFFDLLPAAQRAGRGARWVVWIIVVAGIFEVGYISLQAALGEASHYNLSDTLHKLMFQLMGVGAVSLMVTQLMLARLILRHGRADLPPLWRQAVVLGLVMSFVLVMASAGPLANARPPAGAGLPFLGWHLGGGDLRPAHFIASHAQQLLPLAGWWMLRAGLRTKGPLLLFALLYTGLWLAALMRGLDGAVWLPPPV